MTAARADKERALRDFSAEELRDLADVAVLRARATAEERVVAMAEKFEGPALGFYRRDHQPPAYPADAPPPPPALMVDAAGLAALAGDYRSYELELDYAARRLTDLARRCQLRPEALAVALRALLFDEEDR